MRYLRTLGWQLIIGFILVYSGSCTGNKDQNSHLQASRLFEKSIVLIKAYTDSLNVARDSAHVESLARSFESKINTVNFEFPPETDLKLTQEENDSLIKLIDRLVDARRRRLKQFAGLLNDTISSEQQIEDQAIITKPPFHNQHN